MASSAVMVSSRSFVAAVAVSILSVTLLGCPKSGYIGQVAAFVSEHDVALMRAAWLRVGRFEGPLSIEDGNPDCLYYGKHLDGTDVGVGISDCYRLSQLPDHGWVYTVTISQWSVGNRSDVRAEIDALLEQIRKAIQAQLPDAKVTKGAGAVARPF